MYEFLVYIHSVFGQIPGTCQSYSWVNTRVCWIFRSQRVHVYLSKPECGRGGQASFTQEFVDPPLNGFDLLKIMMEFWNHMVQVSCQPRGYHWNGGLSLQGTCTDLQYVCAAMRAKMTTLFTLMMIYMAHCQMRVDSSYDELCTEISVTSQMIITGTTSNCGVPVCLSHPFFRCTVPYSILWDPIDGSHLGFGNGHHHPKMFTKKCRVSSL